MAYPSPRTVTKPRANEKADCREFEPTTNQCALIQESAVLPQALQKGGPTLSTLSSPTSVLPVMILACGCCSLRRTRSCRLVGRYHVTLGPTMQSVCSSSAALFYEKLKAGAVHIHNCQRPTTGGRILKNTTRPTRPTFVVLAVVPQNSPISRRSCNNTTKLT